MILEGSLLYQEIQKKQRQNEKNNEFALIVQDNNTSTGESSVASIIFLIIMFILGIILAIACAYFLFSCVRSNCFGFLAFLVIVLFLNVPIVNIAVFVILLIWWYTKCRKGAC